MTVGEEQSAAAQSWARTIVQRGLLDEQTARQAFFRYWEAVKAGTVQVTFPAYLGGEGLLSPSALESLRSASGRLGSSRDTGRMLIAPAQEAAAPSSTAPPSATVPLDGTLAHDGVVPLPELLPQPPKGQPRLQSTCKEGVDGKLDLAPTPLEAQEADFFAAGSAPSPGCAKLPMPGDVLGDYEITKGLGAGAMGAVYEVEHTGTKKVYALKVLLGMDKPGAEKRRGRFQREVEALKRLTHPNIIGIHTCGRTGGLDWYVMDKVVGRELKEILAAGELNSRERLEVFEEICKAVYHAHERGVVHRDLKPANVLIDEEGKVLVLDFGLAKLVDNDEEAMELTKTKSTIGTPYYMSPEQFTDARNVDWRADVYGLGVLLYVMICNQRPFSGQTAGELVNNVMNTEPRLPSAVDPKLTPQLDAICLKALAKNREHRYQQVEELRLDVANYRRGAFKRGTTGLTIMTQRAKLWLDRHKLPFLIGVAVASLVYLPLLLLAYML